MNEAKLAEIREIEVAIQAIDDQISELEHKREIVLRSDEEYNGYLNTYASYYDDEPLSIRQYYKFMEELSTIHKKFNDAWIGNGDCDAEAVYQKNKDRLQFLERRLAA